MLTNHVAASCVDLEKLRTSLRFHREQVRILENIEQLVTGASPPWWLASIRQADGGGLSKEFPVQSNGRIPEHLQKQAAEFLDPSNDVNPDESSATELQQTEEQQEDAKPVLSPRMLAALMQPSSKQEEVADEPEAEKPVDVKILPTSAEDIIRRIVEFVTFYGPVTQRKIALSLGLNQSRVCRYMQMSRAFKKNRDGLFVLINQ